MSFAWIDDCGLHFFWPAVRQCPCLQDAVQDHGSDSGFQEKPGRMWAFDGETFLTARFFLVSLDFIMLVNQRVKCAQTLKKRLKRFSYRLENLDGTKSGRRQLASHSAHLKNISKARRKCLSGRPFVGLSRCISKFPIGERNIDEGINR